MFVQGSVHTDVYVLIQDGLARVLKFHYHIPHEGFYSVNLHKLTSMAKVTLDEHCGRTSKDFNNSKRLFANHFKTHSDEVFKCPKCPDVWENGPENQFNSKKAIATHIFEGVSCLISL